MKPYSGFQVEITVLPVCLLPQIIMVSAYGGGSLLASVITQLVLTSANRSEDCRMLISLFTGFDGSSLVLVKAKTFHTEAVLDS